MKTNSWAVVGAFLGLLLLSGCQTSYSKPEPRSGWDGFIEGFLERYFQANPAEAVGQGRHEWDGQLPDWSPEALTRQIADLKAEMERAKAFADSDLDQRQKFERSYFFAALSGKLFWLETARAPYTNPKFYSESLDPNVYVTREYAPLEARLKSFIRYARAVPKACTQIQANLKAPLAKPLLDQGKLIFGGLASYVEKDAVGAFADVKDEALQKELKEATTQASQAFKQLTAFLDSQRSKAHNRFALGAERFQKMLQDTEAVSVPFREIERAGRKDLEENLKTLKEICKGFAPGKSLKDCIAKEEENKPKGDSVTAAKQQLEELKAFVLAKDFVSVPGTEVATVAESPPYMRWNFAYIDIPGPYEKGLRSTYYISPPDPKWSKKEQDAYVPGDGNLLNTSVHEVWPGHFLQFLHANRAKSQFGRVFGSYAFSEGWAHYTEDMVLELGLRDNSPETRIGAILGLLMRDVRLISAIGLHTGGMTQAQSEKLFLEKGLMDAGNAKQQAARGTFDPAYLNYTMGRLMIRKLREDWTASHCAKDLPKAACWKKFHDEFLSYGSPPIPLVRAAMMGGETSAQPGQAKLF